MNLTDFIPLYGSYRASTDLDIETMNFQEKVQHGLAIGAASFVTTVVIGETFGFSQGAVRMAMLGANPLTYTIGVPITVGVVGQTIAVTELSQSDVASDHPWWIAWLFSTF